MAPMEGKMHTRLTLLLLTLVILTPSLSFATEDLSGSELIALEIRNLSTSVDQLTQQLQEQAQKKEREDVVLRKLDIAVAYLNFRSRRIEMLERDLQNTRSTQNRMEDLVRQWNQRLENIDDQISKATGNTAEAQNAKSGAEHQLKMMQQRQSRIDNEIIEFENRILSLQTQIDSVESFVEKHLEL